MNLKIFPTLGKRLIKSELIEIIIPKNSVDNKFYFPKLPNLRDTYLWHIEAYFNCDVPRSIITPTNTVGIDLSQSLFLTLQLYDADNFVSQKPLIDLHTMFTAFTGLPATYTTERQPDNFTGQVVDYSKSYIELVDLSLIPTDENISVLLELYYSDKSARSRADDKRATFKNRS